MSGAVEQAGPGTAEREPTASERHEPVAVVRGGDGASDAHGADWALLAGTELRTLTAEALQLLAATGC